MSDRITLPSGNRFGGKFAAVEEDLAILSRSVSTPRQKRDDARRLEDLITPEHAEACSRPYSRRPRKKG
jgi:hypothetical protein